MQCQIIECSIFEIMFFLETNSWVDWLFKHSQFKHNLYTDGFALHGNELMMRTSCTLKKVFDFQLFQVVVCICIKFITLTLSLFFNLLFVVWRYSWLTAMPKHRSGKKCRKVMSKCSLLTKRIYKRSTNMWRIWDTTHTNVVTPANKYDQICDIVLTCVWISMVTVRI